MHPEPLGGDKRRLPHAVVSETVPRTALCRRFSAALVFALLAASPLPAQHPPLSLCLVQTKPDTTTQYDPSAGPWAVELDELLSTQKLRSGAPLLIRVLAASAEKDVVPEVRRLQCPYVVQLWYQAFGSDLTEDSLLFSLWNGTTGKVIAHGASPIRVIGQHPNLRAPCAALTQEIMQGLNKLP